MITEAQAATMIDLLERLVAVAEAPRKAHEALARAAKESAAKDAAAREEAAREAARSAPQPPPTMWAGGIGIATMRERT